MAGGTLKINFDANLGPLRKNFREVQKLEQKSQQVRTKQLKVEKKHSTDELKRIKDTHKIRDTAAKKELEFIQRRRQGLEQEWKQERYHTEVMQRRHDRAQKSEKRHVSDMNRELGRGPLGRATGRGGGMLGGVARLGMLGGAGVLGFAIGALLRGYQDHINLQKSLNSVIGLGGQGRGVGGAAHQANRGGSRYGFAGPERAALLAPMARATGMLNAPGMMRGMRATGMETGEVANIYGALRQAGIRFGGTTTVMDAQGRERNISVKEGQGGARGEKMFTQMIAAGMYSGLEKARLPEFFQGVTGILSQQQQLLAGVVDPTSVMHLAAGLGRFGTRTGAVGLAGARGAELMNVMQRSLMSPGGGAEGQAFMRQAMGFGVPGGTDFYTAEKRREKGLTTENFSRVMNELTAQWGTGKSAALAMRSYMPGMGLEQAEQLLQFHKGGAPDMEAVKGILEQSKTLEQRADEAMIDAATSLRRIAGRTDKSAALGADAASTIETIEDMQARLLREILAAIKALAKWFEGAWGDIRLMREWIGEKLGKAIETVKTYATYLKDDVKSAIGAGEHYTGEQKGMLAKQAKLEQQYWKEFFTAGEPGSEQPLSDVSSALAQTGGKAGNEMRKLGYSRMYYAVMRLKLRQALEERGLSLKDVEAAGLTSTIQTAFHRGGEEAVQKAGYKGGYKGGMQVLEPTLDRWAAGIANLIVERLKEAEAAKEAKGKATGVKAEELTVEPGATETETIPEGAGKTAMRGGTAPAWRLIIENSPGDRIRNGPPNGGGDAEGIRLDAVGVGIG